MSLRSLWALPLLLAWLGLGSTEESDPGSLHRRYSEATLASDYSRTMDHVLKKNFVEWLLARREKKSQDISELRRELEPQSPQGQKIGDWGAPEKPGELQEKRHGKSFPALEGSEGLGEFLEFLAWLKSGELCRETTE